MPDTKHVHAVQFEPIDNGREVRVRCTKCQANAIFSAFEGTPQPVLGDEGKWTLEVMPFATFDDGKWNTRTEWLDKWLGTECPVSDEAAAEALAADLTNPKPPIVLKG